MDKGQSTTARHRLLTTLRWAYYKTTYRFQMWMGWRPSFAQRGEDLLIAAIFRQLGIAKPTYLDIGAFDPYSLSNTASLYLRGCRGINIEPNPQLFAAFVRERPQDINLNIGIATSKGELDYYIMPAAILNTFSKESAEAYAKEGYPVVAKQTIPVWTLNDVLDTYCKGRFPDFLSIDIEGMELAILSAIDFEKSAPTVICAETLSFSTRREGVKQDDVIRLLESKGYFVYADTYLNTLFVKESVFRARPAGDSV